MKAARIHEYNQPVVLEDVPIPEIRPEEVLVQVKACGMCRSDAQLIDGYFRPFADIPTPITIGHGSYWGNNMDLMEVMSLAAEDRIRHTITTFKFEQINEHLDLLRAGEIVGRAVMKF